MLKVFTMAPKAMNWDGNIVASIRYQVSSRSNKNDDMVAVNNTTKKRYRWRFPNGNPKSIKLVAKHI